MTPPRPPTPPRTHPVPPALAVDAFRFPLASPAFPKEEDRPGRGESGPFPVLSPQYPPPDLPVCTRVRGGTCGVRRWTLLGSWDPRGAQVKELVTVATSQPGHPDRGDTGRRVRG